MAVRRKYPIPEIGSRHGEWTVVDYVTLYGELAAKTQCSCGAFGSVPFHILRKGTSTRCFTCRNEVVQRKIRAKTGYADIVASTADRERWLNRRLAAISRCHDRSNPAFGHYGGRGIFVCDEWRADPAVFLRWVVQQPGWEWPELELDRRDNDKGYSPSNCRLATRAEQLRNRRTNSLVEWNGEVLCAEDFHRKYAWKYRSPGTVARKLREGLSPERIIADQQHCRGAYLRRGELRPEAPVFGAH